MAVKTIQRWGNSLGLRIPKEVAERAHLHEGSAIEIVADDDRIVVTPVRNRLSLDELLAQVTAENLHEGVDTGDPVGREAL